MDFLLVFFVVCNCTGLALFYFCFAKRLLDTHFIHRLYGHESVNDMDILHLQ